MLCANYTIQPSWYRACKIVRASLFIACEACRIVLVTYNWRLGLKLVQRHANATSFSSHA
jgi:hypothetical protein